MNSLNGRFSYGRIFLIGFGFFSISVAWQLYNSFMPLMLGEFLESKAARGSIMGLDNLANIFLIPVIGAWSDKVSGSYGKRLPFLMAGMPLAALFLLVMPQALSLWTLILIDIGFLLSMTLFRAPTVALMPDVTPHDKRSQANGVINFMGGLGALITLFGLSRLYDVNRSYPFAIGAAAMVTVLVLMLVLLRKYLAATGGESVQEAETGAVGGLTGGLTRLLRSKDKTFLLVLGAILFWFIGYSGVEAQFTTYGVEELKLTEGNAALTIGFFSLSFLLFAIPSGLLARRFGRLAIIRTGVAVLAVIFLSLFFLQDLTAIRVVLLLGGIGWALVNIHSYPLVVGFSKGARIGLYTGFYYLFSSVASAAGPAISGLFMDTLGAKFLFPGAALFMLLSLLCLLRIKGEACSAGTPAGISA